MAPNLGSPAGSVNRTALNFSAGCVSRPIRSCRVTSKEMKKGLSHGAAMRSARAALRCCSLRNFVVLFVGSVVALVPLVSVGPAASSIGMLPYAPQYPHQAYGYELALTRLQRNRPGSDWLAAAERALLEPRTISLPFRMLGEQAANAAAIGYSFSVPVGRRVSVKVAGDGVGSGEVFVDLFNGSSRKRERVAGALPGSASEPIFIDAVEGGEYVMRTAGVRPCGELRRRDRLEPAARISRRRGRRARDLERFRCGA
jgi:hypothetical protein